MSYGNDPDDILKKFNQKLDQVNRALQELRREIPELEKALVAFDQVPELKKDLNLKMEASKGQTEVRELLTNISQIERELSDTAYKFGNLRF